MTKVVRRNSSSKAKDSTALAPTAKVTNNVNCDAEDLADATSKVRKQIIIGSKSKIMYI